MGVKNFKNIVLFEGLNALRFFAAFLVVMHHSETIRKKNGLPNLEYFSLFRNGTTAVTFFFVLSGFLITYLLLKETFITNTINVKKFYLKRVLRIWPLYFLLVGIGIIIVPVFFRITGFEYSMPYSFGQVWFYFVFFLPGIVTFTFGHHLLEPLWSIGVEEVFYLIWAPLSKFFKKRMLWLLLGILFTKIFLLVYSGYFLLPDSLAAYLISTFQFEAMAIGGLGAYFVFNRTEPFSSLLIYKNTFQFILYGILAVYILFHSNITNQIWAMLFQTPVISTVLIDFLFLYLIIGVSLNEKNLFVFKNKGLSFLGEISYGIYMYHMLIIFGIILFLKNYLLKLNIIAGSFLFYTAAAGLVIFVAAMSKRYFEDLFLQMKNKIR